MICSTSIEQATKAISGMAVLNPERFPDTPREAVSRFHPRPARDTATEDGSIVGKIVGLPEQYQVARIGKWKHGDEKGIVIADKTLQVVSPLSFRLMRGYGVYELTSGRSRTDATEASAGTDFSDHKSEPESRKQSDCRSV